MFKHNCTTVCVCVCRNRNSSRLSRKMVTSVFIWVSAECRGITIFLCLCVCVGERVAILVHESVFWSEVESVSAWLCVFREWEGEFAGGGVFMWNIDRVCVCVFTQTGILRQRKCAGSPSARPDFLLWGRREKSCGSAFRQQHGAPAQDTHTALKHKHTHHTGQTDRGAAAVHSRVGATLSFLLLLFRSVCAKQREKSGLLLTVLVFPDQVNMYNVNSKNTL